MSTLLLSPNLFTFMTLYKKCNPSVFNVGANCIREVVTDQVLVTVFNVGFYGV